MYEDEKSGLDLKTCVCVLFFLPFIEILTSFFFEAVDAVYFNGANKEGYFFVGATARRHEKLTQTLLFIRVTKLSYLFWY